MKKYIKYIHALKTKEEDLSHQQTSWKKTHFFFLLNERLFLSIKPF